MMTNHFFILASCLTLLGGQSILAGSGIAVLTGESASGRTTISLSIQDITDGLSSGKVVIDGESLEFGEDDRCAVLFDSEQGVYTVILEGGPTDRFPNGRYLRLWAKPVSLKAAGRNKAGEDVLKFSAFLECSEPRPDKEILWTPRVELSCTLSYGV